MARRRPEFKPGFAGAEAAKLNKFSDAGGTQIQWLPDAARTDFSITSGIRSALFMPTLGVELTFKNPYADPSPQEAQNARPGDILLNLNWRRGCYNLSNPERVRAAQIYLTQETFKERLKGIFVENQNQTPGRTVLVAYLSNDNLTRDAVDCYKIDSVFRSRVTLLHKGENLTTEHTESTEKEIERQFCESPVLTP